MCYNQYVAWLIFLVWYAASVISNGQQHGRIITALRRAASGSSGEMATMPPVAKMRVTLNSSSGSFKAA